MLLETLPAEEVFRYIEKRTRESWPESKEFLAEHVVTLADAVRCLDIYWEHGHHPIAKCLRTHIARLIENTPAAEIAAFTDPEGKTTLGDVISQCHPKVPTPAHSRAMRIHTRRRHGR